MSPPSWDMLARGKARLRKNEVASLATRKALHILDGTPELGFDALVSAASAVRGVPISLISLIDAGQQ